MQFWSVGIPGPSGLKQMPGKPRTEAAWSEALSRPPEKDLGKLKQHSDANTLVVVVVMPNEQLHVRTLRDVISTFMRTDAAWGYTGRTATRRLTM